jgi:hypothetical protein
VGERCFKVFEVFRLSKKTRGEKEGGKGGEREEEGE